VQAVTTTHAEVKYMQDELTLPHGDPSTGNSAGHSPLPLAPSVATSVSEAASSADESVVGSGVPASLTIVQLVSDHSCDLSHVATITPHPGMS
jgi:hypothetical protein